MGRICKYLAHFTSRYRTARNQDCYFEKGIKQQSLINIQGWTLNLNWSDKKKNNKDKELTRLF